MILPGIDIDRENPLQPDPTVDGRLWWRQGDLSLCFLSFPALLERYLPHLNRPDYRRQPPVALDAGQGLGDFLSTGELAQANRFAALKRQVEWIAGRLAVKSLVARWLKPDLPAAGIQVEHHPQGAPYLNCAPQVPLSISHAGDYAVAGILLDPHQSLGLDLEQVKASAVPAVLKTAFSEAERRALPSEAPDPVFRRWCLKEAFLKYIGRGFYENLVRVEVVDGAIRHHGQAVPDLALEVARPFPNHILAIVRGPRRSVDQSLPSNV